MDNEKKLPQHQTPQDNLTARCSDEKGSDYSSPASCVCNTEVGDFPAIGKNEVGGVDAGLDFCKPQFSPAEDRSQKLRAKIKIGWFSFSCCEDNTVVMTEVMNDHWQEWKKIFDFRHVRVLKSKNIYDEFDIAFIEGALASSEHEEKVKDIRLRSKKLVAVGACAVTGLPSGQRNTFSPEQKASVEFLVSRFGGLKEVKKVSDVVKVDVEIPGCPMSPDTFLKEVNKLVLELRKV